MGTIKWKNEGENALSEAEIRAESAATEERERTDAEEAFYSADLSEGRTLRFGRENVNLEWKYLPKASRAATRAAVFDAESVPARFNAASEAKFEEADENTDLEYQFFGDNVKENIIVKSRAEEYAYAFELNTNGLELKLSEDNASIELYSSGTNASGEREEKKEFTIPSPFMYDRKGERSDDVYYEIEQKPEGNYIFRVIASAEWINAEEREFPVTIDPQIVTNNPEIFSYQNYYRTLSNGSFGSAGVWNKANYGTIKVGKDYSQEYRTLLTIKKSKLNLADHKISRVILKLRSYSYGTGGIFAVNSKQYSCGLSQIVDVDITAAIRSASGDCTVTFDPYSYAFLQFYASGTNGPVLEVEYLTNEKTRLTKKTLSARWNCVGRSESFHRRTRDKFFGRAGRECPVGRRDFSRVQEIHKRFRRGKEFPSESARGIEREYHERA